MTRTGKTARLLSHIFEPYAEFHPEDARLAGVKHDGLARLTSPWGKMVARVVVTAEQKRGCVFVPMHWNEEFAGEGRVNALVNPAVDPLSGQPESKHTPVKADPYKPKWQAFILSRNEIKRPDSGYWVHGKAGDCWRLEVTGNERPESWRDWARAQLGLEGVEIEWIAYRDPTVGRFRYAAVRDGRLEGCVFISPNHTLPSRAWLIGLFAEEQLSANARMSLLAGKPFGDGEDKGAIVCSCFSVGRNQITAEIKKGADSVEAIGRCLKAGTNCGGCKPELNKLIAATAPQRQAIAS
jgi:assimilatory nitrate reductase catalytic subunit